MNFPTSIDSFTDPTSEEYLGLAGGVGLAALLANQHAALEAIEAKVGADSSAVSSSHDYKLSGVTGTDKAVSKTGIETLTNKTLTSPVINSPTGDVATKTGIETLTNKTITAPILTTPVLGTPDSGILTNCTDLPVAGRTTNHIDSKTSTTTGAQTGSYKVTALTITQTLLNRPIRLTANIDMSQTIDSTNWVPLIYIKEGAAVITAINGGMGNGTSGNTNSVTTSFSIVITPTAASHTYDVYVGLQSGGNFVSSGGYFEISYV